VASSSKRTRAWRWWAAAVVLVALIVATLIFTRPPSKYSGPEGAPRVLVVGDSITVLSTGAIRQTLGSKARLRIEAQFGKRTDEMVSRLKSGIDDPAGKPAAIIINLGTNDALQKRPTAEADYLNLVHAAEKAPCIVLTTVNVQGDPAGGEVVRRLNAMTNSIAAGNPKVRVADWQQIITSNPQLLLPNDQVHPGVEGSQALADLYARTLSGCPNHPVA